MTDHAKIDTDKVLRKTGERTYSYRGCDITYLGPIMRNLHAFDWIDPDRHDVDYDGERYVQTGAGEGTGKTRDAALRDTLDRIDEHLEDS